MAEDLEKEIAVAERKAESMLKELEKIEAYEKKMTPVMGREKMLEAITPKSTPQERPEAIKLTPCKEDIKRVIDDIEKELDKFETNKVYLADVYKTLNDIKHKEHIG